MNNSVNVLFIYSTKEDFESLVSSFKPVKEYTDM